MMHSLRTIALQKCSKTIWYSLLTKPSKLLPRCSHCVYVRWYSSNKSLDVEVGSLEAESNAGLESAETVGVDLEVYRLLHKYRDEHVRKIELALDLHCPPINEELAVSVIKRYQSGWKLAYAFFLWYSKSYNGDLKSSVYNAIIDLLGKMRRFEELRNVLDEMSSRGFVNEETYKVIVNRYASAHNVEEAVNLFKKRRDLGLDVNLVGFQWLLICLCRYKHVEAAETLLDSMANEFKLDTKTLNIVLNGWCVLNNLHETKRFWKGIILSKCMPDLFTYGIFIKALTKKGKLGTALKLYNGMWKKHLNPDVAICNCMIDALCFKKRIPDALKVFEEMKERGLSPNVATYNSLIKHMCKIRRMEKVYDLLEEMVVKGENCILNEVTFSYLISSLRKPSDVPEVLDRMKRIGCKMNGNNYNLLLRLHVHWNCEEKVHYFWNEMELDGLGPDQRSYAIVIHWFYDTGRFDECKEWYKKMISRGLQPDPRTELLVSNLKQKKGKTSMSK